MYYTVRFWWLSILTQQSVHGFPKVLYCCSVVQSCPTLWPHGLQLTRLPCPSSSQGAFSNSCPLSQWCRPTIQPLWSPSSPVSNLSQHQSLFQWVSSLHQVVKVLEFQLQHQSFQRLTSFSIDWFDLLAVQRTLKSLLHHHSLKASIRQHSAFFMVQLSHPCRTIEKTIALTMWIFVGRVMFRSWNV